MSTAKDEATKTALKYYKRVIGSALFEGASGSSIDAYLQAQGVKEPTVYRQAVERTQKVPRLGEWEVANLGGRNPFRALFGLPAVVVKAVEELDFHLTESGDAELFAEIHASRLRYDHRLDRWLIADDESGLWLPDGTEKIYELALATLRERQRRALAIEDPRLRKDMLTWAMNGESRSRLANVITLAEKTPPLSDNGQHWDEDAFLLGCTNGVVDLRTGEFRKALPAERITMRVATAFDPAADCPVWKHALQGIFATPGRPPAANLLDGPEDSETQQIIDFMQRAIGYSLTGDCREECCFFTWGDGRNGKGTIMNTLGDLVGDYRDEMPVTTLEKSLFGSQGIPSDIAKMAGKRFITCSEVNEFKLNEQRLKALTGRDPMSARFMYKDLFTFQPVGKIWIATNNRPSISGTDEGIWSRIHLIPFVNRFEGEARNLQLKDQLKLEYPGILNWAIQGCLQWQRTGLRPPAVVTVATAMYRADSDPINPWLEARCARSPECRVQAAHAWQDYQRWHQQERPREPILSNKNFFKSMARLFKAEAKRQTSYLGVGLLHDQRQPSAEPEQTNETIPF